MKTFTIVNCFTGEVIEVKANFYEIENQLRNFYTYSEDEKKLLKASYHARNWDVRDIKH